MCDPATASLALTAAGGIMNFMQQRQQGKNAQATANFQAQSVRINAQNQQAEADYRAAIDKNNALRAEYLAEDAIARGREEENQERLRGRLLVGQMRAVLAANGAVVDEGSSLGLTIDQQQTNEQNAQTVRNNAAREAQEFRIQGSQFASQAELTQLAGRNLVAAGERDAQSLERNGIIARNEANNAATSSLISSAGSVASKWYTFKQQGAWASPSGNVADYSYAWGT